MTCTDRLEKIIVKFPELLDGVLITSTYNQQYFTDFNFTDGYVLITRHKSYLFADSRYIEAARRKTIGGNFETVLLGTGRSELLTRLLKDNGVYTLGYEDRALTCAAFEELKANLPSMSWMPVKGLIDDCREYKDQSELGKIISAQRIAEKALERTLSRITRDITERELALELEYDIRSNGSEGLAFDVIAVSGKASSLPHGTPRNVKLEKGFLTLDFGAVVDGYRSDMTRTVCIGKADDEMKSIYQTVLMAQTAAFKAIKPGALCREVDRAARDIIAEAGYGGNFGHGLGHGVGLLIHEAPRLSPTAGEKLLESGHVVTVEPGIYIEHKYGVRIEDMAAVTDSGYINLTKAPKDLIEFDI